MKTRQGFVSNSSSSSFIIAIKKNQEVCKCCGRKDPDFFDMVDQESVHNSDNKVIALNEEVLKEFKSYYSNLENPEYLNIKEDIEKHLKNGWSVGCVNISNHSVLLNTLKDNLVESGNAFILY